MNGVVDEILSDDPHRTPDELQKLQASPEYQAAIERIRQLGAQFVNTLRLFHAYAQRCPGLIDTHLFFKVVDLSLQSGLAAVGMVADGLRNSSRREARFLVEVAVKTLFVDQKMPTSDVNARLIFFDQKASTSGMAAELKQITFTLLNQSDGEEFVKYTKRTYGMLSDYAHASHAQLKAHLALALRGITIGYDTLETIDEAGDNLFRAMSVAIVAALHAVGPSMAGDLMTALEDLPWVFHACPSVAAVDTHFDYKHERKSRLGKLAKDREARIKGGWKQACQQDSSRKLGDWQLEFPEEGVT